MGAVKRLDDEPALAPIQAHVLSRAKSAGLTLDSALGRLGAIIQEGEAADALVGIKTFLDYTVGRPATNSKNLHLHAGGKSADKFFDKGVFDTPPAPRLED